MLGLLVKFGVCELIDSYVMKVLLIAFNRPDLTRTVLSRITEAKPDILYVFADGPRLGHHEDIGKCERVREVICERESFINMKVRFQERNMGPLYSVKCALDWYFDQEEEGIIIEDDCLPELSFFHFCEELLSKYGPSENIFMVSGSNFIPDFPMQASYIFSRLALIWGWATWKRSWKKFDASMKEWPNYVSTKDLGYFGKKEKLVYSLINQQYLNPQLRTWGVLWRATFLVNKGLSIIPKRNLVRNMGFGHPDATYHKEYHKVSEVPVEPIDFPLTHPSNISPDAVFDERSLDFYYDEKSSVCS